MGGRPECNVLVRRSVTGDESPEAGGKARDAGNSPNDYLTTGSISSVESAAGAQKNRSPCKSKASLNSFKDC